MATKDSKSAAASTGEASADDTTSQAAPRGSRMSLLGREPRVFVRDSAYMLAATVDDLAVLVRDLPQRLSSLREDAPQRVRSLGSEAPQRLRNVGQRLGEQLPDEEEGVRGRLRSGLDAVQQHFDARVERGRELTGSLSQRESVQRLATRTKTARRQAKGALTSARKVVTSAVDVGLDLARGERDDDRSDEATAD